MPLIEGGDLGDVKVDRSQWNAGTFERGYCVGGLVAETDLLSTTSTTQEATQGRRLTAMKTRRSRRVRMNPKHNRLLS